MLKIIDLFCGTGGFSNGFEQTGAFQVIAGLDFLPDRIATFNVNHPNAMGFTKDIKTFSPQKMADELGINSNSVDVIIGGPPCQGFSSIRPFRSLNQDDMRNGLFHHFGFYLDFFRPKVFVLENVVGLVSHKNGQSFNNMLAYFESLGYSIKWGVLNGVHYGLPQRRERVFLIGKMGKTPIELPAPTHFFNGRTMTNKNTPRSITAALLEQNLPPALTVLEAIHDLPPVESGKKTSVYRDDIKPTYYEKERRKNLNVLTMHESTLHSEKMLQIIQHSGTSRASLPEGMTTSGFSTSYSRLDGDSPAVTLTVNFVHPASNKCIHPQQNRALTPREGARLQGFDDDFVFSGNRTQVVKQIGNAVPPLMGKVIATQVLKNIE